MSRRRKWNHDINLKFDFIFSTKEIYNLSKKQIMIIKKYIDDILSKKFHKFNFSFYVVSIFIVKKFERNLRVYINYKILNAFTIKNKKIFSFIRETLTLLCVVKFFVNARREIRNANKLIQTFKNFDNILKKNEFVSSKKKSLIASNIQYLNFESTI